MSKFVTIDRADGYTIINIDKIACLEWDDLRVKGTVYFGSGIKRDLTEQQFKELLVKVDKYRPMGELIEKLGRKEG